MSSNYFISNKSLIKKKTKEKKSEKNNQAFSCNIQNR